MVSQADNDAACENEIAKSSQAALKPMPFLAASSEMVRQIIEKLQLYAADDLDQKLKIGGFTNYTVDIDGLEQPCETCMYYLVHRKFCTLPELLLPVEPEWSCRLWRIKMCNYRLWQYQS